MYVHREVELQRVPSDWFRYPKTGKLCECWEVFDDSGFVGYFRSEPLASAIAGALNRKAQLNEYLVKKEAEQKLWLDIRDARGRDEGRTHYQVIVDLHIELESSSDLGLG